ncbi:hypothetical protein [Heliophilum fasciatum]|uniref:Uncharacterized protein n=1 Tax=Heliophilum fasciatum TaxID=35700 RepID=A0A4V2SXR2_9FIRM|nr:hypothetical protein [Heliophilum fasciatum]MCW2277410.1 hypothetical protein [Heliophilum fasciatum]TCP67246.1 hypothetical protein EDD73_105144 [Heliophilum fasciatum]
MGNGLDGTLFEFLRVGWWISHIFFLIMIFYLGHRYWPTGS